MGKWTVRCFCINYEWKKGHWRWWMEAKYIDWCFFSPNEKQNGGLCFGIRLRLQTVFYRYNGQNSLKVFVAWQKSFNIEKKNYLNFFFFILLNYRWGEEWVEWNGCECFYLINCNRFLCQTSNDFHFLNHLMLEKLDRDYFTF